MKKAISLILALVLCMSLLPTALAAEGGLPRIRDYADAGFTDVPDDWSREGIVSSYEMGFMSGSGDGKFSPNDALFLSEVVTVAARICDLWQGGSGEMPAGGERWYDTAVDYALQHGIITEGQFAEYAVPATRAEVAGILTKALPADCYKAINTVERLPDVSAATPYAEDIFTLYNAGVFSGRDDYGTFSPDASIIRAEAAAIFCRLVRPETRVSLSLKEPPTGQDPLNDLTVYSTSRKLIINGLELAGVVEIGGEAFFPLHLLGSTNNGSISSSDVSVSTYNGYTIRAGSGYSYRSEVIGLSYRFLPPDGQIMGTAARSPEVLYYNHYVNDGEKKIYQIDELSDAVYTLGGEYPMVRLSALGIADTGGDLIWTLPETSGKYTVKIEDDMVGYAMRWLIKDTPRETLTAIHDYIVNTFIYDPWVSGYYFPGVTDEQIEAAFETASAFKTSNNYYLEAKFAVCQNYSELFLEMCMRAGIPCVMQTGVGNGGSHAWNKVYIDGRWYYVDCTWDDPVGQGHVLRYDYFLIDANTMANDHFWEDSDYPVPREYDPAWEQIDPNNITSAEDFRKSFAAQVHLRQSPVRLRVTNYGAYGGMGILYACSSFYGDWWSYCSGGYNPATGYYEYTVQYGW